MNALADRFLSRGGPPSPPRPPPPCPPHAPCTPLPPEQWAAWIASPPHTGAAASASAPPALPPLPLDSPVILVRRPLAEALAPTADWLGGVDRVQVKLALDDLATGAATLAAALSPPASASASWLRAAVATDTATAAALIASSMAAVPSPTARPPTLTARLELITTARCPLWHCDSVGLRALVTYAGPGTRFIGSEPAVGPREVDAHDGFARPARGGAAVDERAADAAGPGDVLFLGGHLRAGGRAGGGPPYPAAVHQSPPVPAGVVRLVLTVDDAVPICPCDAC